MESHTNIIEMAKGWNPVVYTSTNIPLLFGIWQNLIQDILSGMKRNVNICYSLDVHVRLEDAQPASTLQSWGFIHKVECQTQSQCKHKVNVNTKSNWTQIHCCMQSTYSNFCSLYYEPSDFYIYIQQLVINVLGFRLEESFRNLCLKERRKETGMEENRQILAGCVTSLVRLKNTNEPVAKLTQVTQCENLLCVWIKFKIKVQDFLEGDASYFPFETNKFHLFIKP